MSAGIFAAMGCGGGTSDDSTGGAGGKSCDLPEAKNAEFCAATPGSLDCTALSNQTNQVCGVALPKPPGELTRSSMVKEFAGSGPPQIDCYAQANYPAPPGASQAVTATGLAKIFSSGCNSGKLKITFYTVKPDGELGDPVGTPVTTDSDCSTAGTPTTNDKCTDNTRYECNYSYAGVPTETELAIKTEGAPNWAPLIQYNVYIPNSEVTAGSWTHDVRALAADDYSVIPAAAIGGPITPGNGVVAGEVHDCGDVRLVNAVADIDQARVARTYFGSDEENPLPDLSVDGTSTLGLYAAFDIRPGPVTVAAMGTVNGEQVTLGQHRVWVYPDTVTSLTFKGLQPYQVPK
jgi:hypothetical protein